MAGKLAIQQLLKVTSSNKRCCVDGSSTLGSQFLSIILNRLSDVVQIQKLVVTESDRFSNFRLVSHSPTGDKVETVVKAQQVGIFVIESYVVHSYRMVNRVSFIGLSIVTCPCIFSCFPVHLLRQLL